MTKKEQQETSLMVQRIRESEEIFKRRDGLTFSNGTVQQKNGIIFYHVDLVNASGKVVSFANIYGQG